MAKMKIAGNAMVITSKIKAEDMYLLGNKAVLHDGEGNESYRLEYDPRTALGSIVAGGALFNAKNRQGYLQLTVLVKQNDVEWIKRTYAEAIINLNDAEAIIGEVLDEKKARIEETFADLEVDDAEPVAEEAAN